MSFLNNDINTGKTGVERLRESRERKKQKKRENNARFYAKDKEKILEKRKEQRRSKQPCITVTEQSESRVSKPKRRFHKASQRARKRAQKERTTLQSDPVPPNVARKEFSNGSVLERAIDVTEVSLPLNPRRKVAAVPSKANL